MASETKSTDCGENERAASQERPVENTCPGCGAPVDIAAAPSGSGRRMTAMVDCPCGFVVRLGTVEGWERWYVTEGWPRSKGTIAAVPGGGRKAFYDRLGAS